MNNSLRPPGWVRRWRRYLLMAGGLTVLAATGATAWLGLRPAPVRPNLIIITLDTTRADHLPCYGYRYGETPTIDQLSRSAIQYQRCYAPVPLTLPSHCTLMTGLLPPRHGIRDNNSRALADGAHTLAEILKAHGYVTAAVVGAFVLDRSFGLSQGFDHYDDDLSGGTAAGTFRHAQRNASQVTDAALRFLQRQKAAPVFLWVHYFDPHTPYSPPGFDPKFAARTAYDAEISYVDAQLQRLLAYIDHELEGPSLIVLCADHGEGLNEHGEATHGLFVYESTLRVPLLVRLPAGQSAGTVVDLPVSLTDVMPSVLKWMGVDGPPGLDGSPLPLAQTQLAAALRPIYFENYFVSTMYGWAPQVGIIRGNQKYIRAPRPELYDLSGDPREEQNLFSASKRRGEDLSESLDNVLHDLARQPQLERTAAELPAESLSKLRSLGYVGDACSASHIGWPGTEATRPMDPKDMIGVYNKIKDATLLLEQGQAVRAADMLVGVVSSEDPTNRRAIWLLASLVTHKTEAQPRVIECLLSVVRRRDDPTLPGFIPGNLGLALLEHERHPEAIEAFRRMLELEPRNAAGHLHLAEAYKKSGQRGRARDSYRQALKLVESLAEPPAWLDRARKELDHLERD